MEVVRHQAAPEDIPGKPGAGVDDGLDEDVVVTGLVEDSLAAVTAVEDVIPHAASGGSGSSWHAIGEVAAPLAVNIRYVPFLPSAISYSNWV
jgi:hypothetical protein